jgi:hypothetical protein
MIEGVHVILYSRDAAADREFLRQTIGSTAIDAGDGWLIFALPPRRLRSIRRRRIPSVRVLFDM